MLHAARAHHHLEAEQLAGVAQIADVEALDLVDGAAQRADVEALAVHAAELASTSTGRGRR